MRTLGTSVLPAPSARAPELPRAPASSLRAPAGPLPASTRQPTGTVKTMHGFETRAQPESAFSLLLGGATVRKSSVSLAASGVDRWALQECFALRIEAIAPPSEFTMCILGVVKRASAYPRSLGHNTRLLSRRLALMWVSPIAICVESIVCMHAAFITTVPA